MDREKTWAQTLSIAYGGGPAKGFIWHDADEEAKIDAGLAENPYNHSLLTAKGIMNFNHDQEVAIECFSRALAIRPLDAAMFYNRGRKYLNTFRQAEGLADLKASVALDPENNWAWHYLGVGHYAEGRLEEAIVYFKESLAATMRNTQDLISCEADWLWNSYMHLGREEEAKAAVDAITPDTLIVPIIADDTQYRDTCLLLNGTIPVEDYIATIDPDSVYGNEDGTVGMETGGYNVAKYYYYVEKDLEKAVEWVRKVLACQPANAWGYRNALLDGPIWEAELAAKNESKG